MIENISPIMPVIDNATTGVPTTQVQANYNASLSDVSAFEQSLASVEKTSAVSSPTESVKAAFKPLDYINNEAAEIATYAKNAVASGNELTPSEIVMLTAKSQEFMFHCQLTSSVANRTSEGLQQLFRQQS